MISSVLRSSIRSVPRNSVRHASSAPTTTNSVAVWERQQLYGRSPLKSSEPMHGCGYKVDAAGNYAGMAIFTGAMFGTLFGGILVMESCRKAEE